MCVCIYCSCEFGVCACVRPFILHACAMCVCLHLLTPFGMSSRRSEYLGDIIGPRLPCPATSMSSQVPTNSLGLGIHMGSVRFRRSDCSHSCVMFVVLYARTDRQTDRQTDEQTNDKRRGDVRNDANEFHSILKVLVAQQST